MSTDNSNNLDITGEIFENKNRQNVRCHYCNSLILRELKGNYIKNLHELPLVHQKNTKDVTTVITEPLQDFWQVNDMFTFENVGFSNTVDKHKYLICADCEMGPIGYHDTESMVCYIAVQRVHHGNDAIKITDASTKTIR